MNTDTRTDKKREEKERERERRKVVDAHAEITERIIGCAFKVSNTLGVGFLEKVYENALAYEMRRSGLNVEQQIVMNVHYEQIVVGTYAADLLVDHQVLIELKVAKNLEDSHLAQCLNYLKATNLKTCLLINFGTPKIQIKRVIL